MGSTSILDGRQPAELGVHVLRAGFPVQWGSNQDYRIQGQARDDIHVLSLRYAGTVEDQVYAALSQRFGDIFSVLGQLPDAFEGDWISAVLKDRTALQNFSQRVETAKPAMVLRYSQEIADDEGLDWEYAEKILSSRDIDEWMRSGW